MSMVQYIGARYVPMWYVNSVDQSANWEVNVEYEPLTWVTSINNHLYLSKKTVPDNIGSPAQNTEYWLDMGSFNGQFQDLQDQIDDIRDALAPEFQSNLAYDVGDLVWNDGILYVFTSSHSGAWDPSDVTAADISNILDGFDQRITALEGGAVTARRYIMISDSYGLVRNNTPWTDIIETLINADAGNFYDFSEGGMGFVTTGHGGNTALTLLQGHSTDIADHDTITDIVFGLGINDLGVTYANISNAITSLVGYCKNEYPKAKLYFGFIGNKFNKTATEISQYLTALKAMTDSAAKNGALYITNVEYIMHNGKLVQSDNVHPTTDGCTDIANHIFAFLNGSIPDVIYTEEKDDGVFRLRTYMHNGRIDVDFAMYQLSSDISLPDRNAVQISGSWLANTIFRGSSGFYFNMKLYLYITAGKFVDACFLFGNGAIYVQVPTALNNTWAANSAIVTFTNSYDTLLN